MNPQEPAPSTSETLATTVAQQHSAPSSTPQTPATIALAGNPNVGKSVVFGALTGTYVDVSNYPGTTVELTRGRLGDCDVVDTPGVYGVSSFNEEERVARDTILASDVVINVVDAVHLERDLFLTMQLVDMGKRMIVALNMSDETRKHGIIIDRDLLEDLLGVPVIETVAVTGAGIDELKAAVHDARYGHPEHLIEEELLQLAEEIGSRAEALMVLEGDEVVSARHGIAPRDRRDEIYLKRRHRVDDICGHVITETTEGASFATKLSLWMMNPLTGIPMLAVVLGVVWVVLGKGIAQGLVGFLEEQIMYGRWVPFVQRIVGAAFAPDSPVFKILVGDFGVLTMTPTFLLAVILPLVTGFYLLLALLEDSGYLLRIAALTDRGLSFVGLNGRAVIPLILGLGCVTMGMITTQILGSKRERFIATVLMAIAVPCSAQIAVIIGLMARSGTGFLAIYVALLLLIFGAVGAALNRLMPGESSELFIDLPPLRLPRLGNVVRKSAIKVWHFMTEITLFFAVGAVFISVLDITGVLGWLIASVKPLTVGWLGLPPEAATAFAMGFIRRDFGTIALFQMNLTEVQLLVGMVTITLFVPCIASSLVILKERGWAFFVGIFACSLAMAFFVGGLLSRAFGLFGMS